MRGHIPQCFAAAAGLGNNNNANANDHELCIADGVHSMINTDESDYESMAASEHGSPIPRIPTRIRTRRPTPAYQSTSQSRTLQQILSTIGRLKTRMDGMAAQIRTQEGPIGLGSNGPTRRHDLPAQSLGKEIDEMAMRVANMSHTLSTHVDMIQIQAKEYQDNMEKFHSAAIVKAIAEEVARTLASSDTGKEKGKRAVQPALPRPLKRTQAQSPPPPQPP